MVEGVQQGPVLVGTCFACFCKNFFVNERFKTEHLVATSTWDWQVSKRNSANSFAHSGRFFGSNSGISSWMFACAIGLPLFPPSEVRSQGRDGLSASGARAVSPFFSVSVTGTSCSSAMGTRLAQG